MKKSYLSVTATGLTSLSGVRYVRFHRDGHKPATLRYELCKAQPAKILAQLNAVGFPMHGSAALDRIDDLLSKTTKFPLEPLIDGPGWSAPYFAMPCGRTIAPEGADEASALFEGQVAIAPTKGRRADWLTTIAKPASKSPLLAFGISLAFAAALRAIVSYDIPLGFELVGDHSLDITLVQEVAASVLGPVSAATVPFSHLVAAADVAALRHTDRLMLVGDHQVALASDSPSRQARVLHQVVSTLEGKSPVAVSHGRIRRSLPQSAFLIASRLSVFDVAGAESPVGRALSGSVISLRIEDHPAVGVIDSSQGTSAAELALDAADGLRLAMAATYGKAYSRFIKKLVQARQDDEPALRAEIRGRLEQFRIRVAVDPTDYAAVGVANAFGLVGAAAHLAQRFGALPADWPSLGAAYECYELRCKEDAEQPILERLEMIAAQAVTLEQGTPLKKKVVAGTNTFVRERSDCRELLIRPEAIGLVLTDWHRIRHHISVERLQVRDKKHLKVKRRLHPDLKPTRVYVFRLPKAGSKISCHGKSADM